MASCSATAPPWRCTVSQMGGEGMQWIGMAPFLDRDHFTQNIGDGTFDHSGSLAVRAAVAAGANMTYKLLYNSAVAMTGGQRTASGMTVQQIVRVLLAEGVAKVIVTTEVPGRYRHTKMPNGVAVLPRSRLGEAQRVLAATRGVTVLVHDQECATSKRRKRKRGKLASPQARVFVNKRGLPGRGLPGVHDRGAAGASQPRAGRRADRRGRAPGPPPGVNADSFGIRLAGVGGTGVVTGPMVSDPKRSFPDRAAVRAPITDRVRDGAILVDVRQIVLGLFGDDQFANVVLVGAGFQAGALPLPPDAIEEALRVNGVAVEKNIQAFRRCHQSLAELRAQLDAPAGPPFARTGS
jgi:pyruvate ferredoxin/flavodoxin oxidoreductase-like protein